MKTLTTILLVTAALSAACGGTAANPTNSNTANTTSNSSSNADSTSKPKSSEPAKPAMTTEAFDLFTEIDKAADPQSYVGRPVTITEIDLKKIDRSTLSLGYSWYFTLDCEGSFSDYMPLQDVVAKRDKDRKSVIATIKGTIKEVSKNHLKLEPCALMDVKK